MSLSPAQDAIRILGEYRPGTYFDRPVNLAFHDLTPNKILPQAAREVLGLSLKFIETPRVTTGGQTIYNTFERFDRDVCIKTFFAGEPEDEDRTYHPKMYTKSEWTPPTSFIPGTVITRISDFHAAIKKIFMTKRATPNLSPFQSNLLASIRRNLNILIVNADKGLGPCAVTYAQYVLDVLKHLQDEAIYQDLSADKAAAEAKISAQLIRHWCRDYEHVVDDGMIEYIRTQLKKTANDPFGYFYIMYKIHKTPTSTRPVCSDCSSVTNALGKFIDIMLQPVARAQPSYFKNSYALKCLLEKMNIAPNKSFFSCDAEAMYVNIPTNSALPAIKQHLIDFGHTYGLSPEEVKAINAALDIVMTRNIVRFGDLYKKQISGTAMGTPPAPAWAIIFFAIKENQALPEWSNHVRFWKRFIDDGIGIWRHHPDPVEDARLWASFKACINDFHGLRWTFVEPCKSIDFMDLTMTIVNGKIEFTLFEKALNLYLYIPPKSAHSPGVLTGIVYGGIIRIYQLCTHDSDIKERIRVFFRRLRRSGHCPETLLPLFVKAVANAKKYISTSDEERAATKAAQAESSKRRVFLHLPYHPNDPPARIIQRLWRQHMMLPPGEPPLNRVTNDKGARIPIDQLTVAYSRAPNLGNVFSVRKFQNIPGPNASSFIG